MMYVLYTDDSLLAGPDQSEINQIIKDLKKARLDIMVEGDIQDFLGINIDCKKDGTVHLTQPHFIDNILHDLNLDKPNTVGYWRKLNYLEKATRSDIAYITHQCARFSSDSKVEHGKAIRWLGRYLYAATRDKGTILKPIENKDLEVYVDADFSGNWDYEGVAEDMDTAQSRHGYIIMYARCPILWKSQMQMEFAWSTMESEYTGLSYAL
eukprot:scaffold44736_cov62-Attheya_sp.AAC.2